MQTLLLVRWTTCLWSDNTTDMISIPSGKKPELGDVFAMHGTPFRLKHKLPGHITRVMLAIENCRKPILGGHLEKCSSCGFEQVLWNSCRNRHCPKCQSLKRALWEQNINQTLLPVKHFHLVFTIPAQLNALCLANPTVMYNILFKAASQTIMTLAADKSKLGVQTGMVALLHTWGQNLCEHPHLHTLVPAGGIEHVSGCWKASSGKFFLPVKTISALFKRKFLILLRLARRNNKLSFKGSAIPWADNFNAMIEDLYQPACKWVVFCQPPKNGLPQIVNYLAHYANRVAISNERLISVESQQISFSYKDYKAHGLHKTMALDPEEFIRRFLMHILPQRFCKIRYYGIYAQRNRKSKLALCRSMLFKRTIGNVSKNEKIFAGFNDLNQHTCPSCNVGTMATLLQYPNLLVAPPG